jgi:hypothetical protein
MPGYNELTKRASLKVTRGPFSFFKRWRDDHIAVQPKIVDLNQLCDETDREIYLLKKNIDLARKKLAAIKEQDKCIAALEQDISLKKEQKSLSNQENL